MEPVDESPAEPIDHITAVHNVLATLDPTALCTGFVTIVEWIEEDGQPSLSMIHSPQPPWHLQGVLAQALKHHDPPMMVYVHDPTDEDEGE